MTKPTKSDSKEKARERSRRHYLDNKADYYRRAKEYSRRQKIAALKLHGSTSCEICGEKRPHCLVFHHRDPATKGKYGKDITRLPVQQLAEELDKCDVLCHNCHADVHFTGDKDA